MTKAEGAYTQQHAEAMHLLSQLQRRLENAPAPYGDVAINWNHVGSLAHVNDTLQELVAFLNTDN
jgi:phosphoheptose isomerase